MVRWCKHCDRNEENDENNCFDPLSVEKIVSSDAKSDAKCCGWPKLAPSWPKLNPSWPKLAPSWFKFAPNGPQVGASWPQLGPSQLQVSPSWAQVGGSWCQVGHKLAQRWPMLSQECTTADISKTYGKPKENNDFSRFPCPIQAQDGTG